MGAELTGRLWDHSLPLEASVLLHVWVMAELVLELQMEPWAGNTGGFQG